MVMQDLLKRGFHPFLATSIPMSYDILCDIDTKILRVSVKSTIRHLKRTQNGTIVAKFSLSNNRRAVGRYDLVALVDLPTSRIYYLDYAAAIKSHNVTIHYTEQARYRKGGYKPYELVRTNDWFFTL